MVMGDTTIAEVPNVITKKGETITVSVNEETTKLDDATLVDMYHYGHLDEV